MRRLDKICIILVNFCYNHRRIIFYDFMYRVVLQTLAWEATSSDRAIIAIHSQHQSHSSWSYISSCLQCAQWPKSNTKGHPYTSLVTPGQNNSISPWIVYIIILSFKPWKQFKASSITKLQGILLIFSIYLPKCNVTIFQMQKNTKSV